MTEPTFPAPKPGSLELLALAREHLQREILPFLPPERQREARMVDRAIAVAIAEASDGQAAALARSLSDLGFADLDGLAGAIRSGLLDDDPALEKWLAAYVRLRASPSESA